MAFLFSWWLLSKPESSSVLYAFTPPTINPPMFGTSFTSGVCIGIAISEFAGKLADAVLVAMAAGTFIYVGATEVIAEEFESPQDKWKKFFALTGEVYGG